MKNKKYVRLSFLLLVLIMIAGCVVWFIFTGIDNTKLHKALNSTISFCKSRIVSYDNSISNDRVKSLVRLLDKAEALRDDMAEYASFGQGELDNFIEEQRLTGVLVLDDEMRVVKSSMQEGDTESMWQDILSKDYIVNLLEHPEATYTEQLQLDDTQYDVAIVPRYDASGLLLAYLRKDQASALSGDITLSSLFDSYPFEMSGTVLVCIEGAVVSSNDRDLIGLTSQDINAKYGKNVQVYDNGIGISKEFQNDIFAPFSREQTATKSGIQGTGLGMAISKNIVDMMGGTIKVNSTLGRGSEFIVTIECKISGQTISYMPVPELQGARALA